NNTIVESDESNNTTASSPITVSAEYSATVSTNITAALAGTSVPMHGHATEAADGSPARFKPINIHIGVRGTDRVISANTDADGNFTAIFKPLPGEAGDYTIGACHPGVPRADVQDTFTLLGISASPATETVQLIEQAAAFTGTVTLNN